MFGITDLEKYATKEDLHALFGPPIKGTLETESGEPHGSEAPEYIVKSLDFLSASTNLVCDDKMELIDFDQSFPTASPPQKMLATPLEFLAPEVACGFPPGPASDIWALGCCFFRLRSGDTPFSNPYEVNSPQDLLNYVVHILKGETPPEWSKIRWDINGKPTQDPKGILNETNWERDDAISLQGIIKNIWDEPEGRTAGVEATNSKPNLNLWYDHKPFASHFSELAWNPKAIKVNGDYLIGYGDDWDEQWAALPKIPEDEASLLYDLLSKIFVYDPEKRPTAAQILEHPWFQLDAGL